MKLRETGKEIRWIVCFECFMLMLLSTIVYFCVMIRNNVHTQHHTTPHHTNLHAQLLVDRVRQ